MLIFIKSGMHAIDRRKKLIWTWYLLHFACALLIVAPLAIAISAALGTSLENTRLFQNFDISWIAEFGYSAQWNQLAMWLPLFAMLGAVFVLLTTWLSGGLLTVLRDSSASFSGGCGRWFVPFLRLFLFALIGYGLAFALRAACAALFSKLGDDSMSGKPAAYSAMANLVIGFLAFSFVNMIVDYAKIHMVSNGEKRARYGMLVALHFVRRNFRRTVTIYLALTGYMLLMLAVYHIWSEVIGQSSLGAVLLLFVARQVYMFGRTWLRMVFLASEHAFFMSRMPSPDEPEVPETPTPQHVLESLELNESY